MVSYEYMHLKYTAIFSKDIWGMLYRGSLHKEEIEELLTMCNKIYDKVIWPEHFVKNSYDASSKEGRHQSCDKHIMINLISHAPKILLKVPKKITVRIMK